MGCAGGIRMPRQKSAPTSPLTVSAALFTRDWGDDHVSNGDPGWMLGDCTLLLTDELLSGRYSYRK